MLGTAVSQVFNHSSARLQMAKSLIYVHSLSVYILISLEVTAKLSDVTVVTVPLCTSF